MHEEETSQIRDMAAKGMAVRAIAKALGRNVKTVRKILGPRPPSALASKLDPFKDLVNERAQKDLTATRILREIRERGYTGGITILKDYLRKVRGPRKTPLKVVRRFETKEAEEGQVDWSPYRVPIAGRETIAHCFSMIAACSRKLFIAFYRNERLPTLLHAHVQAFSFFQGAFRCLLYDNQTAVTLGRLGGKPLWNPTFLEFARHYGFRPKVCRPRDPDRRGKVERPFDWIEKDFVRASEFSSWEELNERARRWLKSVANCRVHATTKRVPDEMFEQERPLLIQLPEVPFPTDRREVRKVQTDGCVAVDGCFYPVPAKLVGQHVTVRIYPQRVQILDSAGKVAAAHEIPDVPCRIAPEGEAFYPPRPSVSLSVLETRFLARFPAGEAFLDGLKRRMNALTPIHLRKIEKLAELYTEREVQGAIERAATYRNFSSVALERILAAAHPHVVDVPAPESICPNPAAMGALDDVDSGSPQDYTLDTDEMSQGDEDAQKEQDPA